MASPEKTGPGPLPAIIGGVIAALVLIWLVGVVLATITFFVKVVVFIALIAGAFWVYGKLSGDD
jgi:hypothetical protein